MPVYYSYRRWSTPDQSLGDSDRRQIDAARQRAAELSAVLDDSYCDPGISGFRSKHIKKGALGRFLAAARGEGKVIVASSPAITSGLRIRTASDAWRRSTLS